MDILRAGRFLFKSDVLYAGRLMAVTRRPIINSAEQICLLRLEFEIFSIESGDPPTYLPTGGVASRDLVLVDSPLQDRGVAQYATVFGIEEMWNPKLWKQLEKRANSRKRELRPWAKIQFGPPQADIDFRQPFHTIEKLEAPADSQIDLGGATDEVRENFWAPKQVAAILRKPNGKPPSVDTVNNFVERHIEQYGEGLVRRTDGDQRRINWYLCWHLWEVKQYTSH